MADTPSILLRCEGSHAIGLGHVSRCLALAEAFEAAGARVVFAMRGDSLGIRKVEASGFDVARPAGVSTAEEFPWLHRAIEQTGAEAIVIDLQHPPRDGSTRGLTRDAAVMLRHMGLVVATVDDGSDRRLAAHLAFYPPVPQLRGVPRSGRDGVLEVGWEWVVLGSTFARAAPADALPDAPVLVTMGGSDPAGLTERVVRALGLLDDDSGTIVVLGPGFARNQALEAALKRTDRSFEVCRDVRDMAALMGRCRLAVATYGVTAFELAAMGVPAVLLCLSRDHAESCQAFVESGIALSLGRHDEVTEADIATAVSGLLRDEPRRRAMALRARSTVDGRGAERIARTILDKLRVD